MESTTEIGSVTIHKDNTPFNWRGFLSTSTLGLLLSNFVTIILALNQHWSLGNILIIYWAQSVIIGFFVFIKILTLKNFSTEGVELNGEPVQATLGTKMYIAFFFLFHYGLFHFVYLIFLLPHFGNITNLSLYLLAIFAFFLNHLFSFYQNREHDQQKMQNIGSVMAKPYARIIPMHLIIATGLFMNPTALSLLVFLSLKTLADLTMHVSEHS